MIVEDFGVASAILFKAGGAGVCTAGLKRSKSLV